MTSIPARKAESASDINDRSLVVHSATVTQDRDKVCIHMDTYTNALVVDPDALAKALVGIIPGLSYEKPVPPLPTKHGLYIRKDMVTDLSRAALMELGIDGVWRYHGSERPIGENEMRNVAAIGLLELAEPQ